MEIENNICLSIKGDIATWSRIDNHQVKRKKKGGKPKETDIINSKKLFGKKVRRRRNNLIKLLYSLSKRPSWFITLMYPKNVDLTPDKLGQDINKLSSRLRYSFKDSWFVYTIEWKKTGGFHIHLLGKKNSKAPSLKKLIPKWWSQIVNSTEPGLSDVKFIPNTDSRTHKGYITKRLKWKGLSVVIKFLEKRRSHGVINKMNLPVSNRQTFIMSEKQFALIRDILVKDLGKQAKENAGKVNEVQMRKVNFSDSGMHIMNQALKKTINNFLHK